MEVTIRKGAIEEVEVLSRLIPEFQEPYGAEEYHRRLDAVPHLILIAFSGAEPVGFKVGYERENGFYSWMGGVLPDWRRRGIAEMLAIEQEIWAKRQGYDSITFKTRNEHKNMLIFALKNGFDIIGFTQKDKVSTNRILLRKIL